MMSENYKNIGYDRIKEIFDEGWNQIEFIEIVFREWTKVNQLALNKEYLNQKGIPRKEGDLDQFSLWLVDNIYLQVYCKGVDNTHVRDFCIKHFGYDGGAI